MTAKILNRFLLAALTAVFLISCSSTEHKTGFALQAESWADTDSGGKPIYLTGTKPIDSVDESKLIFDFWRLESDKYPDTIKIFSRVYDSLGNFVTNMADPYRKDLSKKYFTSVTEYLGKIRNIRKVAIDSFKVREYGANDSIPYNIALTVDYSGSMTGVLDAIFEGTELFVSMKQKYDAIALSSFNQNFDLKVKMNNDKDFILRSYKAKRNQNLGLFSAVYDAVWNCFEQFDGTSADVPRVLVVFTDGDDNYSKTQLSALVDSCKKLKLHVFAVAFGYSLDDNLRYLAKYTGGKFYKAYTKQELVAIFRDIYMSLRNFYLITYKPPKFWGYHKVIATVNTPNRADSLWAEGEYDSSDLFPWDSLNKAFTRPILFDFDSAIVKSESFPILDEIADAMLSRPQLKLEVQGHTDNVGRIEYNQDLSDRRAKAVMDGLISRGIDPRKLRSRGFGMSQPITVNDTPEGRAKNRRTQFVVIAK